MRARATPSPSVTRITVAPAAASMSSSRCRVWVTGRSVPATTTRPPSGRAATATRSALPPCAALVSITLAPVAGSEPVRTAGDSSGAPAPVLVRAGVVCTVAPSASSTAT